MRLIFLFILLLTSVSEARIVETIEHFERHISLHQRRVMSLGMALRERFYLGLLSPLDLKNFLRIHDKAKKDHLLELFFLFGNSERSAEVINRINIEDSRRQADFLLNRLHLYEDQFSLMKRIEMIADQVDRGMDPVAVEEFGRPMQRASEFLLVESIKEQALWLEEHYTRIIEGLEYCGESLRR